LHKIKVKQREAKVQAEKQLIYYAQDQVLKLEEKRVAIQ